jgi:CYTH domain-containing protein
MAIEIERRFLVRGPRAAIDGAGAKPSHIVQGYFGCVDNLRVRVRILAKERGVYMAFLTFKGPRRDLCRLEFEYPPELTRARRALSMLPPTRVIQKTRY